MGISVTSNFDINVPAPIDSRMVATNSAVRDAIAFKYAGLKVYVLDEAKTYVYGTNSQWTLDSGGTNINQSGGIYSGNGQLPGDVNVTFGTISSTQFDDSDKLIFVTNDSSGDKSFIYNYGMRKNNGDNVDTMSFISEQKLLPLGGNLEQGAYIEYNGLNPIRQSIKSTLNLGVSNTTYTTRVPRIGLTPLTTEFFSSDDPVYNSEIPLSVTRIDSLHSTIGYNVINDTINNNTYDVSQPGYRMRFGSALDFTTSEWDFDIKVGGSAIWKNMIRIDANVDPDVFSSVIKFRIDNSANDWDSNSPRSQGLRTIPDFVRNGEHRYSKLQIWNQGTVATLKNNILEVNADGNSFYYQFTSDTFFQDIKIRRSATQFSTITSDFQNGSIITISFKNADATKKGFIKVINQQNNNGSKIKSSFTDESFTSTKVTGSPVTNEQRVTILHDAVSTHADIITFRRFDGFWEIIGIERASKIFERSWQSTGTKNSTTSPWSFTTISYLTSFDSGYQFKSLTTANADYRTSAVTTVTNNKPPNTMNFGLSSQTSFRQTTNPEGFKFRISADGNRLVMVQGNFRISFGTGNLNPTTSGQNFWLGTTRQNVWRVGQINAAGLLPQWETAWTFCSGYLIDTKGNIPFTLSNMILSVAKTGDIFIHFNAEAPSGWSVTTFVPDMDIWVPPFTYTSATASYSAGTGTPAGEGPVTGP
jgi:hypothetical protein